MEPGRPVAHQHPPRDGPMYVGVVPPGTGSFGSSTSLVGTDDQVIARRRSHLRTRLPPRSSPPRIRSPSSRIHGCAGPAPACGGCRRTPAWIQRPADNGSEAVHRSGASSFPVAVNVSLTSCGNRVRGIIESPNSCMQRRRAGAARCRSRERQLLLEFHQVGVDAVALQLTGEDGAGDPGTDDQCVVHVQSRFRLSLWRRCRSPQSASTRLLRS